MAQGFPGTDRFEVEQLLGVGTSGEVYRCRDRRRGALVALKTLHKGDAAGVYRFKKEFRALADVAHPNLVQLYELLAEGDRWFFTMELVEGDDFVSFIRRSQVYEASNETGGDFASLPTPVERADLGRLQSAMRQLAEGLAHLHSLGKLHCDLKPSNVRVTAEGRVVILDFGLVKEVFAGPLFETVDGEVSGTPAYMSPEQAAGGALSEASDWYSVGVMLFEALTGRLPYGGGYLKILTDKQSLDAPSVRELLPEAPAEMAELAARLLARDPGRRPPGRIVLERLQGRPALPLPARSTHGSTSAQAAFVGRRDALALLHAALGSSREGRAVSVLVGGVAGSGKTALVRHFLHEVQLAYEDAVLLAGRTYERERVPYKAFDAVVDSLSRHLRLLPETEAEALMPIHVLALARLFPALRRVQAVAGAERRVLDIPDWREQRRRAFQALRELLSRIGERRPLVLWIDDLHWGDLDSAALLSELLRPPDPPSLLLVGSFRSEERERSPLLSQLFADDDAGAFPRREVELAPLTQEEAEELALALLGESGEVARSLARSIARESEGSPFFIDELVRYARSEAGLDEASDRSLPSEVERALGSRMSLEGLVEARLAHLPIEARRLLETLAVAGQPIELAVAREATGLGAETGLAITALRGASLARVTSLREREALEVFHDRIRRVVVGRLEDGDLRHLHRRLALASESAEHVDLEALGMHFLEAGETERGAELVIRAAEEASDALAFDRAARLFGVASELGVVRGAASGKLRVQLAEALANAGRGAESATAYLAAAEDALAAQAVELTRRAAEQQLVSGHIDAGLETVQRVLATIGLPYPATPRAAFLSLLSQLVRLRWRGLAYETRDPSQIAADTLIAIDTCWSVSIGLGIVDTIRGMVFSKRHLRLALDAGEPSRIARGLAIESTYSAGAGNRATARTAALVEAATTLAERSGSPALLGLAALTSGMAAYLEGRFARAVELLEKAETVFRESCAGVTWELDTAIAYQLRNALLLGRLRDLRRRLSRLLKDVRERGDLYAEVNVRIRAMWIRLADGDPDLAQRELDDAIARWSPSGFHVQHYWHLVGSVDIALYRGDGVAAWERLASAWGRLERSLLLRSLQLTRTEARHARGRAALAAALAVGPETRLGRRHLATAEKAARGIERERVAWGDPLARLLRAGVASARGQREVALDHLVAAAAGCEAVDMALYAASARLARGTLLGGDRGRALLHEATAAIAAQEVREPERLAWVLAPGRWG